MALERQSAISADHPMVRNSGRSTNTWKAWASQRGQPLARPDPHRDQPQRVRRKGRDHSQNLADLNTLRTLLRNSVRHKFADANVAVNSIIRSGRGEGSTIIKCWTFRK